MSRLSPQPFIVFITAAARHYDNRTALDTWSLKPQKQLRALLPDSARATTAR